MNSPLLFQEAHPTRAEIVAEARLYLGLPFEMKAPKIVWQDGKPTGKTHCVHLLFTIAQRLGYLPPEWSYKAFAQQARFSPDLSAPDGSLDAALRAVLEANCDLIWRKSEMSQSIGDCFFGAPEYGGFLRKPGDILLIHSDRRNAKGSHHVAIAMPGNKVLHAIDYSERGACKVMEEDWFVVEKDVTEIFRLRGIRDE